MQKADIPVSMLSIFWVHTTAEGQTTMLCPSCASVNLVGVPKRARIASALSYNSKERSTQTPCQIFSFRAKGILSPKGVYSLTHGTALGVDESRIGPPMSLSGLVPASLLSMFRDVTSLCQKKSENDISCIGMKQPTHP